MIVYLISREGRPRYVGQTNKSLSKRMKEHRYAAKKGAPQALSKAIRKYGWAAFKVEVIGTAETYPDLLKLEQEMIAKHATKRPNGYNMTDGGEGAPGYSPTQEVRDYYRNLYKGKKHTPEHIEASRLGRLAAGPQVFTPERLARASARMAGKALPSEAVSKSVATRRGRPLTEEHKAKQRAALEARYESLRAAGLPLQPKAPASGFRGVVRRRHRDGGWIGYFGHKGGRVIVGVYPTPEQAYNAVQARKAEVLCEG